MTESPRNYDHTLGNQITRRHTLGVIGTGLTSLFAGCNARGSSQNSTPNYQPGNMTEGGLSENTSPNASQASAASARAQTQPTDSAIDLDMLELRNHYIGVQNNYKGVTIQGTVEHTGSHRLELAEVRSRIYNTDGNQLGFYLDSTNSLDPGATFNFDILVLESPSDIGSYDIATVGSRE